MNGASWVAGVFSFLVFLGFQAKGIYAGDSGDLVTAAALGGVPHPPGYPLYTLLGFLVSKIPLETISWRVTFLSSVPHALVVALTYALVFRMTKGNVWASIFASLTLSMNYLFFLYSVTPEVFALFDMFVAALFFLLFSWNEKKDPKLLYAAIFVFGLSLSHHHVMLFLIPAFGYFLWMQKIHLPKGAWMVFVFGLLPYVYIPFAAQGNAIINWDRAINWQGFVRLITRADYGTFVSGGSFGQTIYERLLAVFAYGQFLVVDWTWIGIGLSVLGVCIWFRRRRIWFWTSMIALLSIGPLFFFYASFPLASRFTLGTFERFLLPTYVLLALCSGQGFDAIVRYVEKRRRMLGVAIGCVLFLYPVTLSGMTLWRFWGLPEDKTAQNLGRDILEGVPDGAIVLLFQDTTLFTTQYVRYALGFRPDTSVLHAARLPLPDYQSIVSKQFPKLVIPLSKQETFLSSFIKANRSTTTRVYSNGILPVGEGWYWVPKGLLYEVFPESELPQVDEMYAQVLSLQPKLQDPKTGILSRYSHLMLSDVLDVYASSAIAVGKTLVRAERWSEAHEQFSRAVSFSGDTSAVEAYELLGLTKMYRRDCYGALSAFQEARKRSVVASPTHPRLESVTYAECVGDVLRARELFYEYEALVQSREQSLEAL